MHIGPQDRVLTAAAAAPQHGAEERAPSHNVMTASQRKSAEKQTRHARQYYLLQHCNFFWYYFLYDASSALIIN